MSFDCVAPIDYALIGKAVQYYVDHGYTYVEVPWAVSTSMSEKTLPEGKFAMRVSHPDILSADLLGSAEQGLIDLVDRGKLDPNRNYVAVSPCFRAEAAVEAGVSQFTFMKVELFSLWSHFGTHQWHAWAFFRDNGLRCSRDVVSPDQEDLVSPCGVEMGSYGFRQNWSYGTGLALPRFSTVLARQEKSDEHR